MNCIIHLPSPLSILENANFVSPPVLPPPPNLSGGFPPLTEIALLTIHPQNILLVVKFFKFPFSVFNLKIFHIKLKSSALF